MLLRIYLSRFLAISLILQMGLFSKVFASGEAPNPIRIIRVAFTACCLEPIKGFLSLKQTRLSRPLLSENRNLNDLLDPNSLDFRSLSNLGQLIRTDLSNKRFHRILDHHRKTNPEVEKGKLYEVLQAGDPKLLWGEYLTEYEVNLFQKDIKKNFQEILFPGINRSLSIENRDINPLDLYKKLKFSQIEQEYSEIYRNILPFAYENFLSVSRKEKIDYFNPQYEEMKRKQKLLSHVLDSKLSIELRISKDVFIKELLRNKLIIAKLKRLYIAETDLQSKDKLIDSKILIAQTAKIDNQEKLAILAYFDALQMAPLGALNNPSFISCMLLAPLDV